MSGQVVRLDRWKSFGEGDQTVRDVPRQGPEADRAVGRGTQTLPLRRESLDPAALLAFERSARNHPTLRRQKAIDVRQRFGFGMVAYQRELYKAADSGAGLMADVDLCLTLQAERESNRAKRNAAASHRLGAFDSAQGADS